HFKKPGVEYASTLVEFIISTNSKNIIVRTSKLERRSKKPPLQRNSVSGGSSQGVNILNVQIFTLLFLCTFSCWNHTIEYKDFLNAAASTGNSTSRQQCKH